MVESSPKPLPYMVYCTFRDSRGLTWMGIENGLLLMRESKFIHYTYSEKDSNSILDGRVYSLAEDNRGNIWAATLTHGISIFNPVTNFYKRLTPEAYPSLLKDRVLNTIDFLGNDTMILNTKIGAYKMCTKDCRYRPALSAKYNKCEVYIHRTFREKEYFLLQGDGLLEIDSQGVENLYTLKTSDMNFMGLAVVNDNLYLSGFNGLYKLTERGLQKLKLVYDGRDISDDGINDVLTLGKFMICINSIRYGCLKSKDSGNVFYCTPVTNSSWYNSGNSIYSNFYDPKRNSLFVGTQQGFFVLDHERDYFREIVPRESNIGTVRTMVFNDNKLYIGTEGGCFVLKNELMRVGGDKDQNRKMIFVMFNTASGELFGSGKKVFRIKNRFEYTFDCNKHIPESESLTLSLNLNDSILFVLPTNDRSFIYYNHKTDRSEKHSLSKKIDFIYPLHLSTQGILVNSFNGLYLFDLHVDSFRKVSRSFDAEISDFKIVGDRIYYSSTTNGIVITDEDFNLIKKIDISKLAGTNEVTAFEILNNVIWFSNESGIGFYKLSDGTAAFFKSGTYFTTNRFLNSSVTRLGDTVYFGGENGVVAVNTKAILAQTEIPKCYLIDVSVYEKGNLLKVEHPDNHTFKYTENNLEIRLVNATTDFSIFKHYQYQLNNNSLIPIDESGMIKLYNLSPDEYQLKVFEIESGTVVCEYKFVVSPPWYQTWWFRALLGMGILANGIWISRLYFKRKLLAQQKEIEKQQALQSERDRISSDMHDDLGSGLSSIKLISEMLKTKHADSETTNDLNEIVQQATGLTDTMREMVWSLNPRNDVLPRFVDHIVRYTRQFLQPTAIALKLKIDPEFPELPMNGFVRRNLFLCLKELLNNIVKHAHAQNVTLLILFSNRQLTISVIDDGIGLGEPIKAGNGLYSLRKRMAECKGYVEWKNTAPGLCTTLRVTV